MNIIRQLFAPPTSEPARLKAVHWGNLLRFAERATAYKASTLKVGRRTLATLTKPDRALMRYVIQSARALHQSFGYEVQVDFDFWHDEGATFPHTFWQDCMKSPDYSIVLNNREIRLVHVGTARAIITRQHSRGYVSNERLNPVIELMKGTHRDSHL